MEIADGILRQSLYIVMRDGVRIAVDIFTPSGPQRPLPLIWSATPYRRAYFRGGELIHFLHPDRQQAFLQDVCRRGYVVALADIRGTGASFGNYTTTYCSSEIDDAVDIMDWFASQEWCDGNIGMYGRSYLGYHQYQAVLGGSPHLKALFACVCAFDRVPVIYPGGIYVKGFFEDWFAFKKLCDLSVDTAPVDGDEDGVLLGEAQREHAVNVYALGTAQSAFREDIDASSLGLSRALGHPPTPAASLDELNKSAVPTYNAGGWYDLSPRCTALLHANLQGPRKLLFGPWHHGQLDGFDFAAELIRWFDHWLKRVPNGIMDEPAVTYCVEDENWVRQWRTASDWPVPEIEHRRLYLHANVLRVDEPRATETSSALFEHSVSMGTQSRWRGDLGAPVPMMRDDVSWMSQRCLTFTSEPQVDDMELVGHPVVCLQASSGAADFDCIVYLAVVRVDGSCAYLAEGLLRATFRAEHHAPYRSIGLPYRRQSRVDVRAYRPGTVVELHFELTPTARLVRAGQCLRVFVSGYDGEIYDTLRHAAPASMAIHSGPEALSWIDIPLRKFTDQTT